MKPAVVGKAISVGEMMQAVKKQADEQQKFYNETGLCVTCRTAPATNKEKMRCQPCVDKIESLLGQLRGTGGFMEMNGGR